jgi:hypothetical protein
MQGNRALVGVVVAIVVLAGGWLFFKRSAGAQTIQLIPVFASADKRPAGGTFEVVDADVNGESKQAIYTVPTSRIIYKVRIPDEAWLRVAVATRPDSWTQEGDGVLFRVGVSDGRRYDELFTQHVNPFSNEGDRKWVQVWVDLSAYGSEEVELIFNTNSSPEGKGDDNRNDHALWGAPEIVVR